MSLYVPHSLSTDFRPNYTSFSAWAEHAAFGYDLVTAQQPGLVVELGSWQGFSFFVFCQAVKAAGLDSVCYAIDTWEGDDQSGAVGSGTLEAVETHIRDHYRGIAYPVRANFDVALEQFNDNSIDLLHIDGLHTYEAVSHDFSTWLPKVKPGGIILFHDILGRNPGFGAWTFWQELMQQHEGFHFNQGHGLGVLRKPGVAEPLQHPLFELMFNGSTEDQAALRQLYNFTSQYIIALPQALKFRAQRGRADRVIKE